MLKKRILTLLAVCFLAPVFCNAQDENKEPTPEEIAEKETERLEKLLKLEDWQVFYVDSTLRANYTGWMKELDQLRRARVENADLYYAVQDKWSEKNEEMFHRIFTPEQWKQWLKSGGERTIKEREKRRQKADTALEDKKKKKKK